MDEACFLPVALTTGVKCNKGRWLCQSSTKIADKKTEARMKKNGGIGFWLFPSKCIISICGAVPTSLKGV
jgi:hypothetical protein